MALFLRVFDVVAAPFVYLACRLLRLVRGQGFASFPTLRKVFLATGVLPVIDHYYEPFYHPERLRLPPGVDRNLPGIDLGVSRQLSLLPRLGFPAELAGIGSASGGDGEFHFGNNFFEAGDAEIWYGMVRHLKPRMIVEIGSGYSTLLARRGVAANAAEDPGYRCEHVCIEPFEREWLERLGVTVVRRRVEEVGPELFSRLGENDLLFIDSSHVIRPGGDVLFEYLELLPSLRAGVVVHIHDIFTPKDYLRPWMEEELRLWNEQYLLEAFLCSNSTWEVVAAVNFLKHHHFDALREVCPYLTPGHEPGSFYIRKIA